MSVEAAGDACPRVEDIIDPGYVEWDVMATFDGHQASPIITFDGEFHKAAVAKYLLCQSKVT